jgi:signal transduction histidine kinase
MKIPSFLQSRRASICMATFFVIVVGAIDYATGREIQVLPLYLLPLAIATWGVGRKWGIFISVVAAGVWLGADLEADPVYAQRWFPYWNALMVVLVFIAVSLILSKLHDLVTTLEQRVQARTEQLKVEMAKRYQAELAQLRAERLAVVGTMAAQVAHEVRNPLGSISLNIELLSYEISQLGPGERGSMVESSFILKQMSQELARINRVVRDYLGCARLPQVVPQELLLHAVLKEKLEFMEPELAAAQVRLREEFDPKVQCIQADPEQLWRVILNLIRNALEAMARGGELRVSTKASDSELQICVSDTGAGMTESEVAKLFTPFFTTKAQGTGLGLALSQQIVAEHGGHMECRSAVGVGTTFTVFLPLATQSTALRMGIESIPNVPYSSSELQCAGAL